MRKINWFARLFMKWNSIVDFIKNDYKITNSDYETKIAVLKEKCKNLEEKVEDLVNRNKENKRNFEREKEEKIQLRTEFETYKNKYENLDHKKHDIEKQLFTKESELKNLREKLLDHKNDTENMKRNILEKLTPLKRINETFFAKAGNKGKGMLGEKQLNNILEKSGIPPEFWVKNLVVGNDSKNIVEFAIKVDKNKWIPIDSKVLDTDINESNEIVIDSKYETRVKEEAKKISKYLNKSNTGPYGMLVLQSDDIYLKLMDEFPNLFHEVIDKYKIHIASPSSFIQFAWSISYILNIYQKINKDEKIYDQMIQLIQTMEKLGKKLYSTYKEFTIAMDTHYPTFEKRYQKLTKSFVKTGKIKELPQLELKTKENNE